MQPFTRRLGLRLVARALALGALPFGASGCLFFAPDRDELEQTRPSPPAVPVELFQRDGAAIATLVVTNDTLYFTLACSSLDCSGIYRIPAGTPSSSSSGRIIQANDPSGLALAQDRIYWSEDRPDDGVIQSADYDGNAQPAIASQENKPTEIAVRPGRITWLLESGGLRAANLVDGATVDTYAVSPGQATALVGLEGGGAVYVYIAGADPGIYRPKATGAQLEPLGIGSELRGGGLGSDSKDLYWVQGTDVIGCDPDPDPKAPRILCGSGDHGESKIGIASSGTVVAWYTHDAIYETAVTPKSPSTPVKLASIPDDQKPVAIAVDDAAVYYVLSPSHSSGVSILRVALPPE